eukprot:COSAG02_NODE_42517_length_384_cov_0.456140_2_plen_35_part_01
MIVVRAVVDLYQGTLLCEMESSVGCSTSRIDVFAK